MTRSFVTVLATGAAVAGLTATIALAASMPIDSASSQDRADLAEASRQSCGNIEVRMEEGQVHLTASCWPAIGKSDRVELGNINKKRDVRTN